MQNIPGSGHSDGQVAPSAKEDGPAKAVQCHNAQTGAAHFKELLTLTPAAEALGHLIKMQTDSEGGARVLFQLHVFCYIKELILGPGMDLTSNAPNLTHSLSL